MSRGTLAGWIALGAVVVAAFAWIVVQLSAGDNTMSGHGWIALFLGSIGTAAIAGILMWLLFHSDRHDR